MKVPNTIAIVVGSMLIAGFAQARPQHDGYHADRLDRYETRRHDSRHRHGARRNRDQIRLDLPVHIRGDQRVALRRLINRHYRINLDHYRLRKVVVNNHSRRHSMARLRVGYQAGPPRHLNRGRNVLSVPNQGYGKWVLGLDNVRVNNIRVVLEPRQRLAYHY